MDIAFSANIKIYKLLLLWPIQGNLFKKILHKITFCILYSLPLIFFYGNLEHLKSVFRGTAKDNLVGILQSTEVLMMYLTCDFVCLSSMLNQENVILLIEKLADFKTFPKHEFNERENNRFNKFTIGFAVYASSAGTVFHLMTWLYYDKCIQYNEKLGTNRICELTNQVAFPFEINYTPMLQLVSFIQAFTNVTIVTVVAVVFLMICACCHNLILRIQTLKKHISECFTSQDPTEKINRLRYCINFHNFIIDTIKLTNECFGSICMLTITSFGLIMACIAVEISLEKDVRAVLHIFGWLVGLAMINTYGQWLMDEVQSIADAVYEMPWYGEDVKLQKTIKLILVGSQRQLVLQAGKFSPMCFITFVDILKSTYSFVAVLNVTMSANNAS